MNGSLPLCMECGLDEGAWGIEGVGNICNKCMVRRACSILEGFISIRNLSISFLYKHVFGKPEDGRMQEAQIRVLCKAIETVAISKEQELYEPKMREKK